MRTYNFSATFQGIFPMVTPIGLTKSLYCCEGDDPVVFTFDSRSALTYEVSASKKHKVLATWQRDSFGDAIKAMHADMPDLLSTMPRSLAAGLFLQRAQSHVADESTSHALESNYATQVHAFRGMFLECCSRAGFTRASRTLPVIKRHKVAQLISGSVMRLTFLVGATPVKGSVLFFPSPIEEKVWLVRVYFDLKPDLMVTVNHMVTAVLEDFSQMAGITIRDVTQGTNLMLYCN